MFDVIFDLKRARDTNKDIKSMPEPHLFEHNPMDFEDIDGNDNSGNTPYLNLNTPQVIFLRLMIRSSLAVL